MPEDYGFDFNVRLTEGEGTQTVSGQTFDAQLKGTGKTKDENFVDLTVTDWLLYLENKVPVVLFRCIINSNIIFWEIAQDYALDKLEKEDKDWRKNTTKRICFEKVLTKDLNELKNAVRKSQARIIRNNMLLLEIGEGVGSEIEEKLKHAKRYDLEAKALTLVSASEAMKHGDFEKSKELLIEVYKNPKNDEPKIRAIIGLVYQLNIADSGENQKAVEICEEGLQLSTSLGFNILSEFLRILRDRAILFQLNRKITEALLSTKIANLHDEHSFLIFYTQQLTELEDIRNKLIQEINRSLSKLIELGSLYYYLAALPLIIDVITVQISTAAVFDKDLLRQEKEGRRRIIDIANSVLLKELDPDLKLFIYKSLGSYYYHISESQKAIELFKSGISLAEKEGDIGHLQQLKQLVEMVKQKPNLYEVAPIKQIDEMTVEEYQEITRRLINAQGIDPDGQDDISKAISIGIRDMNPKEYFLSCERLRIAYLSTSPVGRNIGLPSLGSKTIWCDKCTQSFEAFDLKGLFEEFRRLNCANCKYCSPRDNSWKCNVGWVKEQQKDVPILHKRNTPDNDLKQS